jgi:hypothetical protein
MPAPARIRITPTRCLGVVCFALSAGALLCGLSLASSNQTGGIFEQFRVTYGEIAVLLGQIYLAMAFLLSIVAVGLVLDAVWGRLLLVPMLAVIGLSGAFFLLVIRGPVAGGLGLLQLLALPVALAVLRSR